MRTNQFWVLLNIARGQDMLLTCAKSNRMEPWVCIPPMSQGDRVFYKMLKVLFIVMILQGIHTFLILRNEKIDREFFYVAGYCEVAHCVEWSFWVYGSMWADTRSRPVLTTTKFWTSHECLLLPYMSKHGTRIEDSTSGLWYDCSANFLRIGEQTHQLDPWDIGRVLCWLVEIFLD